MLAMIFVLIFLGTSKFFLPINTCRVLLNNFFS